MINYDDGNYIKLVDETNGTVSHMRKLTDFEFRHLEWDLAMLKKEGLV